MLLNARDAQHFCRRVGFGSTPAEVAHFVGRERADVVNEVLNLTASVPGRPGFIFPTDRWWEQWWPTTEWWVDRMVTASWADRSADTPSPLIEKMTLFWHGHFACSLDKVRDMVQVFQLNQIHRTHALADYEALTKRVSTNGAMLTFLDNDTNRKGAPQENFARELMELFTIGVGNFSENDVIEMARAWTGHGNVGLSPTRMNAEYRFHPGNYDNGSKTLFGKTRNWNGPQTVTELVKGSKRAHTARHISRKLWLYFVNGEPTDAQVQQIANAFSSGGMSVNAAMRALLLHDAFWAQASRHAVVRPPVEWIVDIIRRTSLPVTDANLEWLMPIAGQTLFEPPNVAGWGTHDYWISTSATWGKGMFVRVTGNQGPVKQRFAPIQDMNVDDSVAHVLSVMGLNNLVSPASYQAVREWVVAAKAGYASTQPSNAFRLAAMLPEFQTA